MGANLPHGQSPRWSPAFRPRLPESHPATGDEGVALVRKLGDHLGMNLRIGSGQEKDQSDIEIARTTNAPSVVIEMNGGMRRPGMVAVVLEYVMQENVAEMSAATQRLRIPFVVVLGLELETGTALELKVGIGATRIETETEKELTTENENVTVIETSPGTEIESVTGIEIVTVTVTVTVTAF